jgi:hypothetical protein
VTCVVSRFTLAFEKGENLYDAMDSIIQVDIEDEEPRRVIRKIDGSVFEYVGESDREERMENRM